MNEFTKDELEDIENGLGWLCEHNPFHKVEIGKLMTKVKSMIDNYDKPKPYMDITLSDGTKVECLGVVLGGGGGNGGCG